MASKIRSQCSSPSARETGRSCGTSASARLQTHRVRLHDAHVRPTFEQAARRRKPDGAEAQEQHRSSLQAAGGRVERRREAVRGRLIVADAARPAHVEGDEARVVGEEQHLGAHQRRLLDAPHVDALSHPRVAPEVPKDGGHSLAEPRDETLT